MTAKDQPQRGAAKQAQKDEQDESARKAKEHEREASAVGTAADVAAQKEREGKEPSTKDLAARADEVAGELLVQEHGTSHAKAGPGAPKYGTGMLVDRSKLTGLDGLEYALTNFPASHIRIEATSRDAVEDVQEMLSEYNRQSKVSIPHFADSPEADEEKADVSEEAPAIIEIAAGDLAEQQLNIRV